MSKKLTLSADGLSATVADATFQDILTTAISSDEALTGMYKYVQLAATGLVGAAIMNKRHTGSYTNFGR